MTFINVEGENGLVRDESGVILNTNSGEIAQAKARKKARLAKDSELIELKKDVDDIKTMLSKLMEKIDGA
tara:strand:+ start:224 stop:433 length:210 start_codon:yes stop_codon:yes gene_type:complete